MSESACSLAHIIWLCLDSLLQCRITPWRHTTHQRLTHFLPCSLISHLTLNVAVIITACSFSFLLLERPALIRGHIKEDNTKECWSLSAHVLPRTCFLLSFSNHTSSSFTTPSSSFVTVIGPHVRSFHWRTTPHYWWAKPSSLVGSQLSHALTLILERLRGKMPDQRSKRKGCREDNYEIMTLGTNGL